MTDELRLDELERLEQAATPGPWETSECDCDRACKVNISDADGYGIAMCWPYANIRTALKKDQCASQADAALIVAARNALPALIRRIRELEQELFDVRDQWEMRQ
jgi:hypothetical protein